VTTATGPYVTTAYLGWGNPERDAVQMRLYATDVDDSPRWAPEQGGRVVEYACTEHGATEGDRFLVVRLGNRFVKREDAEAIGQQVAALVERLTEDDRLASGGAA
jgi:hypothetical protein